MHKYIKQHMLGCTHLPWTCFLILLWNNYEQNPRFLLFLFLFYIWWICEGPPDIIVMVHPILLRWVHTHLNLYALTLKIFQNRVHCLHLNLMLIFWEILENDKFPGRGGFEIYTSSNQVAFPIWCFPSISLCFIWWNKNMFWVDVGARVYGNEMAWNGDEGDGFLWNPVLHFKGS